MIYAVLGVAVLVVVWLVYRRHQRRQMFSQMDCILSMLRLGTADRLLSRYSKELPFEDAIPLSKAVTFTLFMESLDEDSARFKALHKDLVDRKIMDLTTDFEIRTAVNDAAALKCAILQLSGQYDETIQETLANWLDEMNMFTPPSEEDFKSSAGLTRRAFAYVEHIRERSE